MHLPTDPEIRLARRVVWLVGAAFLLTQLLAFSADRPPGWDEAIYLSQVDPGTPPLPFVASRARGITLLALPVLQLGGSLSVLRLFLAAASSLALVASHRAWTNVVGLGAAGAAAIFAFGWPALFYGSELMPNLWTAFVCVGATAVLGRRLARGAGRFDELLAGGLVALAALLRPLDAVVLASALVLLPIAVRRATLSWVGFVLTGLAAGWAPWLIEMVGRFGSPMNAFREAAELGHTGWSLVENVRQYLALSDGPTIGPVAEPNVPISGVVWVVALLALAALGIRAGHARGILPSLVVPTATGAALAAEYIVFTGGQAPRFLLPAVSLVVVPAGLGLSTIVTRSPARARRTSIRPLALAATAVLFLAWAVPQVAIAGRIESGVVGPRVDAARVGARIEALAGDDECQIYAEMSFPLIGYAAGCSAAPLGKVLDVWPHRAERLAKQGVRAFLVLHGEDEASPNGAEPLAEVPSEGSASWFVYGAS